jgi:hypothetical protein
MRTMRSTVGDRGMPVRRYPSERSEWRSPLVSSPQPTFQSPSVEHGRARPARQAPPLIAHRPSPIAHRPSPIAHPLLSRPPSRPRLSSLCLPPSGSIGGIGYRVDGRPEIFEKTKKKRNEAPYHRLRFEFDSICAVASVAENRAVACLVFEQCPERIQPGRPLFSRSRY